MKKLKFKLYSVSQNFSKYFQTGILYNKWYNGNWNMNIIQCTWYVCTNKTEMIIAPKNGARKTLTTFDTTPYLFLFINKFFMHILSDTLKVFIKAVYFNLYYWT